MGALGKKLEAVNDPEGDQVPPGLPKVVDGHVHLFPDALFSAVWQWFDQFGWPVRYKLPADGIIDFFQTKKVDAIVALQYAHKPGVADKLNEFMAKICKKHPRVLGMATVFPGEPKARRILQKGFDMGLSGVKLHCHVQCFDINSRDMDEICRICADHGRPLIIHAGKEPKSPAYGCDPYELCAAEKMERLLGAHPDLRVCVPHLGADEFEDYRRMARIYDNLWLDTTMALGRYLPFGPVPDLASYRQDRIFYGTDFPNIPYAWDRELKAIQKMGLDRDFLEKLLHQNVLAFIHGPS